MIDFNLVKLDLESFDNLQATPDATRQARLNPATAGQARLNRPDILLTGWKLFSNQALD
jgi:hypothetical protein